MCYVTRGSRTRCVVRVYIYPFHKNARLGFSLYRFFSRDVRVASVRCGGTRSPGGELEGLTQTMHYQPRVSLVYETLLNRSCQVYPNFAAIVIVYPRSEFVAMVLP